MTIKRKAEHATGNRHSVKGKTNLVDSVAKSYLNENCLLMVWTVTRSLFILLCGLMSLLFVHRVQALTYVAEMELDTWKVVSSPFVCRLKQEIPGFGEAAFEREGGGNQMFYLKSPSSPFRPGRANLVIRKPHWGANRPEVDLGFVNVVASDKLVSLNGRLVDRLLMELYMGMSPTFTRTSTAGEDVVVDVALTGINFRKVMPEYQRCFSQLFPYNFNQLSLSEVRFENADVTLNDLAKKRLNRIVQYIKTSPESISLQIDGYADKAGRYPDKIQLAQQRAAVVAEYLLDQGVKGEVISINHHAEPKAAGKVSKALIKLHK